jgi:hypothetical protein
LNKLLKEQGTDLFCFEYGCIAFDRMAATHMLKLRRIQYRCLRIALGLMQFTHVQTIGVIGEVPPLMLVDMPFDGCLRCFRD